MKKETMKEAALAAAILLLVLNSIWIRGLKSEIRSLKSQTDDMEMRLSNSMISMENKVSNGYLEVENMIKKDGSMFSGTSVTYKLKGKKLLIQMQAFPKEISNEEELFARVYAGEAMYEEKADAEGYAEILIDMAETVKPVFVMKSENGTRQEAMEETYTGYLFEADVYSTWGYSEGDMKWRLTTWVNAREDSLPFDPEEVETAEYIIKSLGAAEETNTDSGVGQAVEEAQYLSREEEVRGLSGAERVPAVKRDGENKKTAEYYADLSAYGERKDGIQYGVYLCLTMKDGTVFYTPFDSVSTFSSHKNTSEQSSTYGRMVPVYLGE